MDKEFHCHLGVKYLKLDVLEVHLFKAQYKMRWQDIWNLIHQVLEQHSEFYNQQGAYPIQEIPVEILKTHSVRCGIYAETVRETVCVEKLPEILFFQTAHGIEQHPPMRLLFKDMPVE
jgi:virulence-associated protein VapD